jgi:glycosyltransferase involved in cell wall biosynthesis
VDAARLLKAEGVALRAVIVGIPDPDSPDRVPAEVLEAWSAEGIIEWWGLRDDMPAVIADASIVALPSYYREGVPKVLLEAAASGRPAVTTDMPGCREAVRDGYSGILVAPRDVPALAAALRRLLSDPALRETMGQNARRLAEAEFGERTLVAQGVEVFEQLLHDPGRA